MIEVINELIKNSELEKALEIVNEEIANSGNLGTDHIMAGTSGAPVTNLYGLILNFYFGGSLIEPGTASMIYSDSWLTDLGTTGISISKLDMPSSYAYAGVTRISHTNKNGYGKIATFRFQANTGILSPSTMEFQMDSFYAIDSAGTYMNFNTPVYAFNIDPSLALNVPQLMNEHNINISPNPFVENVQISYVLNVKENVIVEVYDVMGEKLKTIVNAVQTAGEYKYNFLSKEEGFDAGIYFVKISIDGKETVRKIVEMK